MDRTLIVFVDDLDRLDPDEIQTVLKLVRLVANFPNIIYVLAMDEEIVASSIQIMYSPGENGDIEQGLNYLEKFIQLPLYLPKPNSASLFSLFRIGLEEIRKNLQLSESIVFEDVLKDLSYLDFSPRSIKRVLFTYEFYLKVLQNEVNKSDLLRLTVIKILKPEIHEYIYQNKLLFTSITAIPEDKVKQFKAIRGREPFEQILLHLVPNSFSLFGKTNAKEEVEKGKKRLADRVYFDRYFRNVLLDNEVSQQSIDDFLEYVNDYEDFELRYLLYENTLRPYPIVDFHLELQHKISEMDPLTLITIVELAATKYNRIHENRKNYKQISALLISCEALVRSAATILHERVLDVRGFSQWNLMLWLNIVLFMNKDELGISDEKVKELLHNRYDG